MASRLVTVDEAAHQQLAGLAVIGAAIEIFEASELRWLDLDPEQQEGEAHA